MGLPTLGWEFSRKDKFMIYAYIRVSTDKQFLENQEFEIKRFCKKENIIIDKWIKEKISGTMSFEKRKLGAVLKHLRAGDVLICSEISRLGRNLLQIMSILNICLQKEVAVWTIKDNFRLGVDIQSKVVAFAFGLAAEIERNLISQRTREALARVKSSGKKLGRRSGSKNRAHVMDDKREKLIELLAEGMSKRQIAMRLGISVYTLYRFLQDDNMYG